MYEPRQYDSPPMYSPHYSAPSDGFYSPRGVHPPRVLYGHYLAPEPCYEEGRPQHFYRWFSPPGIVKTMEGLCVLLCFVTFACVASTLVWDMHGYDAGFGAYVPGSAGFGYNGGTGVGTGTGYYGGTYGYHSSYMTPHAAKGAMIAMAAINFIIALAFLVATFSKAYNMRGCRFYLVLLVVDMVLAIMQGIINIIFVIGVNPMAQSSQSMLYNPILMMCQTQQATSSSYPGGYPMFNQYIYHYCYMDPEEAVALVCGLMVMVALLVAAYFAYKTRSKIWRHGKANIYWEEPLLHTGRGQRSSDWVTSVGSTQMSPTVVISEKAVPELRTENSVVSYPVGTLSVHSQNTYNTAYSENFNGDPPEPSNQDGGTKATKEPGDAEPATAQGLGLAQDDRQYETGYTTGETTSKLNSDHWERIYPEITSDSQRQEYKGDFSSSLAEYKRLCVEMDDISDQMNTLRRELDALEEGSAKFQAVADEYNHLKDLKRTPEYQTKKLQCKNLREKLFHIKRLVKKYDKAKS
ncbi:occludin [Denticeps clupeoides]|uniref:occludin n=1 Tax=Denticeps clupeoides TaxID=299321 RepID=UPI0010A39399|nr:occludin-like [Denticeps clupeoides]